MNYIFDNTYVFNANVCRDIGDLYAVYNKENGTLMGYRAITRKVVNDQVICSASFPREVNDLTPSEIANAKRIEQDTRA